MAVAHRHPGYVLEISAPRQCWERRPNHPRPPVPPAGTQPARNTSCIVPPGNRFPAGSLPPHLPASPGNPPRSYAKHPSVATVRADTVLHFAPQDGIHGEPLTFLD